MTAQPEASGFWSGESNSNAAAWLVVEEANPGAFKGRLASFREIALAPLRLLFEPHAIVPAPSSSVKRTPARSNASWRLPRCPLRSRSPSSFCEALSHVYANRVAVSRADCRRRRYRRQGCISVPECGDLLGLGGQPISLSNDLSHVAPVARRYVK